MPSIVKNKGMAKAPSFYKGGASTSSSSTPVKTQNLPILIGVVAVGAAIILYMRTRELSPSNVGPALTVVPTTDADQSQIANMIQALKAIGGMQTTNPNPGGGTQTPITPTNPINPPNTQYPSNPGGGIPTTSTPSAFVRQFGATPNTIYEQVLAKIRATSASDVRNGVSYSKTRSEWETLFQQYGGAAGLAAYQTVAGVPSATGALHNPQANVVTPGANQFFTGVVGTTNAQGGITYQAYRDGQLIGESNNIPGGDTAAWGASLGLNPSNWYA